MTLDGNSLYTYLDPRSGGKIAVAEACRNLACVGATPIGVTNCLNFGNPEKPEIMWQFQEVVEGMSEACKVFDIPVTGGNVSFYNDTEGVSIYPTPVLGIVGMMDDIDKAVSPGFKEGKHIILLIGENKDELGASEYLKWVMREEQGSTPEIDLEYEKRVHQVCLDAIEQELLFSAHDISEGGLAICAAECVFLSPAKIGCSLELKSELRPDVLLFGETQSRILVTISDKNLKTVLGLAEKHKVSAAVVGTTGGDRIKISINEQSLFEVPVMEAFQAWKQAIPEFFRVR